MPLSPDLRPVGFGELLHGLLREFALELHDFLRIARPDQLLGKGKSGRHVFFSETKRLPAHVAGP